MSGSTADLALRAEQRAATAALLGWLLLEEPGPRLADLVATVPELAPLGEADRELAVAYERLLLRVAPPYESVYRGEGGQRGGPVARAVADTYARAGFDEATTDRWRVAGPDHLGLELRCFAHLCAEEAVGWRDEHPDRAARSVEQERVFLAAHLAAWADVALDALDAEAVGTPYAGVVDAVREFLAAEVELLRPAPRHPGSPDLPVPDVPERLGPARLASHLLSPERSGIWLDRSAIGEAAGALGIPWRPSDQRGQLRHVVEAALDGGELSELLARIRPVAAAAVETWARRERERPGMALIAGSWRGRAEATVTLLDRLIAAGDLGAGPEPTAVRLEVDTADAATLAVAVSVLVESLAREGVDVTVTHLD